MIDFHIKEFKARMISAIGCVYEKFLTSCAVCSSKLNALIELATDVSLNWFPQYPLENMQIRLKKLFIDCYNEL